VLRELGQLDEAQQALEQAVQLSPSTPLFYLNLANARKFSPDDPHLTAMAELARDAGALDVMAQIDLHFALGKALADVGQHEQSFQHLLRANTLKRQQIEYDEPATRALFDRIRSVFTPVLMLAQQSLGEPSRVPVFIVGMPRSGTTLVEQIVASHPMVFGAGELNDFESAILALGKPFPESVPSLDAEALRRLGADYLSRLPAAGEAERVTDKMPSNFRFLGLIHLALPRARIVHVRRDAVDTCLSCFSNVFAGQQAYTYDLAELGRYYRMYEDVMAHWRAVLPAGVMLEVRYEDVVADLERQARRIIEHCGLDWDAACLRFHETARPVRTASATQVRQPIYSSSVGRWHAYASQLGPLLDALGLDSSTD